MFNRSIPATISVVILAIFYGGTVLMTLLKLGQTETIQDNALGVKALMVWLITAVGYILVVRDAPSKLRWFYTGAITLGLGLLTFVGLGRSITERVYDESYVIGALLLFAAVCLPLIKFFLTFPKIKA